MSGRHSVELHPGLDGITDGLDRWLMTQVIRQAHVARYSGRSNVPPVTQHTLASFLKRSPSIVAGGGRSPSTLSRVTSALLDSGLLVEGKAERWKRPAPGRRPVPLRVNENLAVLAVFLADARSPSGNSHATEVTAAAVGLNGVVKEPIDVEAVDEPDDETLVELIAKVARQLIAKHHEVQWLGMAVTVGGQIRDGKLEFSPNLGDTSGAVHPLRDWKAALERKTGLPTTLENDANALALFERWFGRRTEHSYYVVLLKADGIGGGIIEGDRLLRGGRGAAGEIGHLPIDARDTLDTTNTTAGTARQARLCRCGRLGCLETIATPHAISEELGWYDVSRLDGLVREYQQGDRSEAVVTAFDAVSRAGRGLGVALATVLNFLDVELVIVTGVDELTAREEHPTASVYLDAVQDAGDQHCFGTSVLKLLPRPLPSTEIQLVAAALTNYANRLDERSGILDEDAIEGTI